MIRKGEDTMAKKRAATKRSAAKKRTASKRPAAKKRAAVSARGRKTSARASKRELPNDEAWRELIATAIENRGPTGSK